MSPISALGAAAVQQLPKAAAPAGPQPHVAAQSSSVDADGDHDGSTQVHDSDHSVDIRA